jgi:spore maturation protein CgeB/SAM-dependent methyltransferase
MISRYDKVNFLYRSPNSIYSPYMYFQGLRAALERNGLLHYAFDVTGSEGLDLKELLRYPILCITGSSEPLVDVVAYLRGKQFIAEICPESLHDNQLQLKRGLHEELRKASDFFDLYFTPIETDLASYWGKPCYWLPSWAHTEVLGDHYARTVQDKIGFIGQRARREEFFSQDKNGILYAANTHEKPTALENLAELCKGINHFGMLVNPESSYVAGLPGKIFEILACNRLCFSQLNDATMFKSALLFQDGVDAVYFRSFEELESKFRYYASHPEKLEQVALAGFRKVRQFHSADVRVRQMVERLLHHANGAAFQPGFNEESNFNDCAGKVSLATGAVPVTPSSVAKPFMDESEIASIRSALQIAPSGSNVLEWGSGNSTLYFSQYLAADSSWLAIEHNEEWAAHVCGQIEATGRDNVALQFIPADGPFLDGIEDGTLAAFRRYVTEPAAAGNKFGLILVDGRARVACMGAAWDMLEANGIMVLHDAQRQEYHVGVPGEAYCLTQRHPVLQNNGDNIMILFMAKEPEVIGRLHDILVESIPHLELKLFRQPAKDGGETTDHGPRTAEAEPGKRGELGAGADVAPAAAAASATPSILFLNTYYGAFLARFYRDNPGLTQASYQAQKQALIDSFFGDSDFYSRGMREAGWKSEDRIVNCEELQGTWARENGCSGSLLEVAVEQVRRCRPDVVYIQDLNICSKEFLDLIRPHATMIVGQIASPLPSGADLQGIDAIVSSFPHFVERFRQAGINSYYQPLAFEPRILAALPRYLYQERPVECAFVGGLSTMHSKGYELMEYLAREVPIHFWGYGAQTLPADSAIAPRHNGEVWGREMFGVLASTRISVNRHIDVAEENANNMRLFEATGCGSLLVTDYKENLNRLFEIGKEVVAYRSQEECAALIQYYLAHPEEAAAIARAGQERTLREHSYGQRMAHSAELLGRQLRYRREAGKLAFPERISDGHQAIAQGEVTRAMEEAWKDPGIPARQRALVQEELQAMYRGEVATPFQVLAQVLRPVISSGSSVLEIGCASGYYCEVLEHLLNRRLDYTGVDYSEAMISMAREYYPKARFYAADGACLFFADRSFHTVISSGVLLHVPNYREHIFESARLAERFIVASRTPVCRQRPTQYLKKFAYGVETVELVFNEAELVRELALNGFKLAGGTEYHSDQASDSYQVTYLFQRERR